MDGRLMGDQMISVVHARQVSLFTNSTGIAIYLNVSKKTIVSKINIIDNSYNYGTNWKVIVFMMNHNRWLHLQSNVFVVEKNVITITIIIIIIIIIIRIIIITIKVVITVIIKIRIIITMIFIVIITIIIIISIT